MLTKILLYEEEFAFLEGFSLVLELIFQLRYQHIFVSISFINLFRNLRVKEKLLKIEGKINYLNY